MREGAAMNRVVKVGSLLLAGALTIGPAAFGQQEKPRVYISGTGNVDVRTDSSAAQGSSLEAGATPSTVDAHNRAMGLAKDFAKQCPGVIVTLNATDADYTVGLNHEAFHGLIFKNNQVMVTNRRGDLLMANATRTVSHSTNDSCAAILADWKANGRIEAAAPMPPAPAPASEQQAAATPAATTPAPAASVQFPTQVMDPKPEPLGDAARRLKAQQKDHPSPPSPAPQN
jgi:hypothetical protein